MSAARRASPAGPPAVATKIDAERRRLQCAAELLACVAVAFDGGRDLEFSDAMLAVRAMIDASVTALDSVELRRPASTDSEHRQRAQTAKTTTTDPAPPAIQLEPRRRETRAVFL